ncbi:MAG: hypothetical protein ACFFB2_13010 [Promethearchaeota archaeon]
MHWDSFFRQLNSENPHEKEKYYLCQCRESGKGGLIHEPGRKLRFIGQCTQEKACFKIRFDSKRILSKKLQIIPKSKKRKEKKKKAERLTLDKFLSSSYRYFDPEKTAAE